MDTEPSLCMARSFTAVRGAQLDFVPADGDVLRAPLDVPLPLTTAHLLAPCTPPVTDSSDIGDSVRNEPTAYTASAAWEHADTQRLAAAVAFISKDRTQRCHHGHWQQSGGQGACRSGLMRCTIISDHQAAPERPSVLQWLAACAADAGTPAAGPGRRLRSGAAAHAQSARRRRLHCGKPAVRQPQRHPTSIRSEVE